MSARRATRWKLSGLLALIVAATFLNTLANGFVWDDRAFVVNNLYLRDSDHLADLIGSQILEGAATPSNFYRPVQALTHFVDVQLFGLTPWGHHLSNVLIQVLMAVALFWWLARAFPPWPAFLAAAWFAIHPIQSEAVAYVSGRGDVLGILFLMLGLLCFRRSLALSALCAVLAIGSKESLVTLPFLLLLSEWLQGRHIDPWRHLPFWILSAIYVVLRLSVLDFGNSLDFYDQPGTLSPNPFTGALARISTYLTTLPGGLRIWLWPYDLHHERSWEVYGSLASLRVVASAVLFACLAAASIWLWRTRRATPLVVGLLWFVAATLPTSNLIALINAVFYDHWFILPGIGLAVVIAYGLSRVWDAGGWQRGAALAAIGAYGAAFLLLTPLVVNASWKDGITVNERILRYEPGSGKAHHNLALAYTMAGRDDAAAAQYQWAIQNGFRFPMTHSNLGYIRLRQGRPEEAEREFLRAVELDPAFYEAWLGLGNLWFDQREFAKAADALTRIHDRLGDEEAMKLAMSYRAIGELESSYAVLVELTKRNPRDVGVWFSLGRLCLELERYEQASTIYREFLKGDQTRLLGHLGLGHVALYQGRLDEALDHFNEAIELDPQHPDGYIGLARYQLSKRRVPEALRELERGLERIPDSAELKAEQNRIQMGDREPYPSSERPRSGARAPAS